MSWSRQTRVLLCAGLFSLATARLARAADANAGRGEADLAFLKQALAVNEVEIRLGHLAAERGASAETRAMGAKMIAKHTQLGGQLSALAREAGMSGGPELSQEQRSTLAQVESKSGTDFDSTFKRTVDDGHVKELAMYREEVGRASSPGLRAAAEQRVAVLQDGMGGAMKRNDAQQ